MALAGVRVVELAGLAPGPFCGMILQDFGAQVIRVDRDGTPSMDVLGRGKKSIAINLKNPEGIDTLLKILAKVDVVIEPFRPGVMEKLGLGPEVVTRLNPKIVYARLTGFGQDGPYAMMAGHDINYAAISGVLSIIGRKGENPVFPGNILSDFAGGGLMCALGITIALLEKTRSGKGQVVDTSMVEGSAYLSSFVYHMKSTPLWDQERGTNTLDGGAHFYEVYKTKDGKYVSVGAIEPQFYAKLIKGLGLEKEELPEQLDKDSWGEMKNKLTSIFSSKTRDEWMKIFDGTDACVTPVLEISEVQNHPHNIARKLVSPSEFGNSPNPAPRLSRTPARIHSSATSPQCGQHTREILSGFNFSDNSISHLENCGAVYQGEKARL